MPVTCRVCGLERRVYVPDEGLTSRCPRCDAPCAVEMGQRFSRFVLVCLAVTLIGIRCAFDVPAVALLVLTVSAVMGVVAVVRIALAGTRLVGVGWAIGAIGLSVLGFLIAICRLQ